MKTIAEVMKKADYGDVLTDGKRYWHIVGDKQSNPYKVASPRFKASFELWGEGSIEKVASIPRLKVVKSK